MAAVVAVSPIRALSPVEEQVVRQMRQLSQVAREWKLTVTLHQRQGGSYLQLEPTPYLKLAVQPDAFLAVE